VTDAAWQALLALDSPTVANAVETFHARPHSEGYAGPEIRCLFPGLGVMLGYAVTAWMEPREEGEAGWRRGYLECCAAVERGPRPAVLVIQDSRRWPFQAALVGEVVANVMQRLGAVGCVTDGAARDLEQMEALGFHTHAAGVIVSHGQMKFGGCGAPVHLGRWAVRPGDLIHADRNGVVVIPGEIAAQVPDAAKRLLAAEAEIIAASRAPEFSAGDLEEFYRS
jgi:4-hydroxy-4-methyl-2-oxoglutarate aldolase